MGGDLHCIPSWCIGCRVALGAVALDPVAWSGALVALGGMLLWLLHWLLSCIG